MPYTVGRVRTRANVVGMTPVATEPAPAAPPTAPWLAKLCPESVAAVRAAVAEAPPLTDGQRRRLRMLFRGAPAAE